MATLGNTTCTSLTVLNNETVSGTLNATTLQQDGAAVALASSIPSGSSLWNSGSTTWTQSNNVTCKGNGEWSFDITDTAGSETAYWHVWSGNLSASMLSCYPSSGKVKVGYNLVVSGNITASSDKNLKENIEEISHIDLSSLSTYKYNFKNDKTKEKKIGLIAQEVQAIYPEAVKVDKLKEPDNLGLTEHLSLDYNAITALLVGKVNELETKNEELEERLSKLEKLMESK